MIDARRQVCNALKTVCDHVQLSKPEGDIYNNYFPFICVAERINQPVTMCHIRLGWRVAVYAQTFDDLADLVDDADSIMTGLGYMRTAKTPDDQARIGTDLYLCRLDYSAIVDTRNNTIVPYSK